MGWRTSRRRWAAAAAVLLAAMGPGRAQVAPMEPYQEAAGLANMAVACLEQASDGTLWICTENGLFRFDGFRIRREPLPAGAGMAISDVVADPLDRVWVATDTGLFLRREERGRVGWSPVVRPDGVGLGVEGRQRLAVDAHGKVFAMDRRSQLWTIPVPAAAATLSARLPAAPVARQDYAPFPAGFDASGGPLLAVGSTLWFGCGHGLCRWRDGRLRAWSGADGLPTDTWGSLLAARDGSLWARGVGHLAQLRPGSERFETVAAPAAKLWPATIPLAEDRDGLVMTAADDGLARWDGHAWQRWTTREGVPETAVRALLFDGDGELWIGSAGRGVHRWNGYGRTEQWTTATGLPSPVVWSFVRDAGGRLVVATSRGVATLDEATRRFVPVGPVFAPAAGSGIATDERGGVWWVDDGHVLTLAPGARRAREAFHDRSLAFALQASGSVILFGAQGAQRLLGSPAGPRRENLPEGMPDPSSLSAIASDGQREWFLVGGGAYRIDHGRWERLLDDRGQPVAVRDFATFCGPAEFWAADTLGVAAYGIADGVARLTQRIAADALGTANTAFVRSDGRGRMWIGTDRGVFVHTGSTWTLVDRDDGLSWNDLDGGAVFFDRDGAAWVGTSAGATRIRPDLLVRQPATLRLEEVRLGDRSMPPSPALEAGWSDRRLRLTLQTPQIARGRTMRLEYRLHEDAAWEGFEGNVLHLADLAPDTYLVQVRAAARNALEAPGKPVEIALTITPPWWRSTPVFLGAAALLVGVWLLSIQGLRARARATRRRLEHAIAERTTQLEQSRELARRLGVHSARSLEEERKRVARELHDEMGQQLAALRMEISVLRLHARAARPPDEAALGTLLARVDGLVASMRGVVAQLRPPALDGGLAAALDWLGSEFERHAGVGCDVEIDDCARLLSADSAAMVFRIAQESLSNVRRHAAAKRAWLKLQRDGVHCELSIRDDGIGFDKATQASGYGLLGMEERARALSGTLSVTSAPGQGTIIGLRLPLL